LPSAITARGKWFFVLRSLISRWLTVVVFIPKLFSIDRDASVLINKLLMQSGSFFSVARKPFTAAHTLFPDEKVLLSA